MYKNLNCNLCEEQISQSDAHLLDCSYLIKTSLQLNSDCTSEYEDIFMDIKAQVQVTKIYKLIFEIKSEHEESTN